MSVNPITNTEILNDLNALREAASLPPVKKGSYTRAKMLEMIEALHTKPVAAAPAIVEEVSEAGDDFTCPLCEKGTHNDLTAAGAEGTFLGDSCLFCHQCGKVHNVFTQEEVEVKANGSAKKRRILNPQAKINAKAEALAKVGIEQFYDKPSRVWTFTNKDGAALMHMASREYAEYKTDELVKYLEGRKA